MSNSSSSRHYSTKLIQKILYSFAEYRSNSSKMEDFKALLKCPVCYDKLTPPVQTCVNGHVTCQRCKDPLPHCPTCRGNFIFKNTFVDTLLDVLPVPCLFELNGCEKVMNSCEKNAHESICNYRLVKCPNSRCKEPNVIFYKLKDHLNSHDHDRVPITFGEKSRTRINLKNAAAIDYFGIFCETNVRQYFCLRCVIDPQKQTITVCVQYIGRREKASAYIYEVNIDQGLGIKLNFGGYCLPYMDKDEEIKSNSKALTLGLDQLFFKNVPDVFYIWFAINFSE